MGLKSSAKKLTWLANILPGGDGWRNKNRLSWLSQLIDHQQQLDGQTTKKVGGSG